MTSTPTTVTHQFHGEMIEPGDPAYADACRTVFADGSPRYVLRPRDLDDVQAAVLFAADSGVALSVRGGGHSFPGFGTNEGGVVLDLQHLDRVQVVDNDRCVVRVGGGARWGRVADALAPHGLAISAGDTRSVGVGGLTLSGGIGWKVRKYGLALDNVIGVQVVTADGEVVHASAEDHPDLFWALRGGGGNVGVVTSFDFIAHVTTDVFHGTITFPAAETDRVLQGWAEYLRTATEDLTSHVILANPLTGGPQAPLEVHVCFDGEDPRRAADAFGPIRRLGTVLDQGIGLVPYTETLADGAVPPSGLEFDCRSAFVDRESVTDLLHALADASTWVGGPAIALRSLGGAVARVPPDATAYAHRQAELLVVTMTAGPPAAVEAARPGLHALWTGLDPHVHGAHANFLSGTGDADVAAVYPMETRARLSRVKEHHDPDNVFAGNHNIRPGGSIACTSAAHGTVG